MHDNAVFCLNTTVWFIWVSEVVKANKTSLFKEEYSFLIILHGLSG